MAIPKVKQTITDGALGIADSNAAGVQVKAGVSSAGTPNTLYSFSDPQAVKDTLGRGPLVEAIVHTLSTAGGPVLAMPVTASVAGTLSAVTKTGTGTGTVTLSGAPYDTFDAIVEITRDGTNIAAGTGTFKYTLDGGDVYSPEIAIPTGGTYAIPDSGVTLTFVNGGSGTSFVKGDKHAWTAVAPGFSASDLTTALTALRADPAAWGFVHVVGAAANASGAATIAAAVDVQMAAAEAQYRYVWALLEAPEDTDSNLKTAFASFTSTRVAVAAGACELTSSVSGRSYRRSAAWPIAARIAQQDIRRDAARVRDDREGGPLEGVTRLYRDEYVTEALDEARFMTLRTFPGRSGFFITNGRLMAGPTSDYQFVQYRRIMDVACAINYRTMLDFLNDDAVRVDATTGYINEVDARAIEATVEAALDAELTARDRVSAVDVILKRDANILSTQTFVETVRIQPKGYSKFIDVSIGFFNPALTPKAA